MATPPRKAPAPQQIVQRDPVTGRLKKGAHLSPATMFQRGQIANALGESRKVRLAKLIEKYNADEHMVKMASGNIKAAPTQTQVNAYHEVCEQTFGRPTAVSVSNENNITFVKRVIGVDDGML